MVKIAEDYPLLFWDVNLNDIDSITHKQFIIERVLEKGSMDSVRDLLALYNEEEITDALINSRNISPKTANFWKVKLNITGEIKCLQMQSQKTQPKLWKS